MMERMPYLGDWRVGGRAVVWLLRDFGDPSRTRRFYAALNGERSAPSDVKTACRAADSMVRRYLRGLRAECHGPA